MSHFEVVSSVYSGWKAKSGTLFVYSSSVFWYFNGPLKSTLTVALEANCVKNLCTKKEWIMKTPKVCKLFPGWRQTQLGWVDVVKSNNFWMCEGGRVEGWIWQIYAHVFRSVPDGSSCMTTVSMGMIIIRGEIQVSTGIISCHLDVST